MKPKKVLSLYSYDIPNIVIVGDISMKRKIPNMEKNFNVVLKFSSAKDLEASVDGETIAVIIDEVKIKSKARDYLLRILKRYNILPVFYLSRKSKRPSFYKELYEKGIQGVINWPKEAGILHGLIIESLKPQSKIIGKSKGDKKLAKIIKSHILLSTRYKSIKVKVIEGFVFLEGTVKSLFDREIIERESSKVLGVKRVVIKNIKIKKDNKTTDKELERKIKMYIGHILGDKKRSLSVKVRGRVATLIGAATGHGEVLDIENFIMKQSGIQDIIRLVKYRPALVSKSTKKAKSLEQEIKNLFEGVKYISISIYGDFAEVSGTVRISADKTLVEKYLLQVLPIKKVINKLFISKAR